MKYFIGIILVAFAFAATAQNKLRTADELINPQEPGWTLVSEMIRSSKNKVEILSVDSVAAKDALYKIQVTTRSPMGAIVYGTGGILVDDGWIRILGSGSAKLQRTLPDWNKGKAFTEFGERPPFLLVADDAIGGFFMLNGGGLGQDVGKIYYLSPDNLQYEPLDITYTEFLQFCFDNHHNKFYKGKRWTKWRDEVARLHGDSVFTFAPFLWTKEGKDINKVTRSIVPVEEQYNVNMELLKQMEQKK